ncbi:MAG: NADH-quinone oxidoreductase subunit A [Thermoflexales bacterium]|nr:NADH-quinone oxidoreductase subunit A [Thermoflexales bacterium]MCS7324058.1 NADH-quinone oxidoreductase subunit A [Thermoflexales bacterium]MCX7939226.1 NADH-quinone oxidoreductase subunit A [Thermoflexales bacterium]MDW8054107.1 NADH-quinone oxidoreductase subunit A [Anaerolineae bacterium]MDW8293461.1 NADH-quinone oxidoreductase subunit A [Anaerolineae bacterium]
MSDFLPILVLLLFSVGLVSLVLVISVLFGPRRRSRNEIKLQPYESGMRPIGPAQRRLPVRFYLIAVLFILFDIEVIFFFPWAVAFRELGWSGLAAMLLFVAILEAGHLWLWRRGALEWEKMDKS